MSFLLLRKRLSAVGLVGGVLAVAGGAAWAKDSVPDWVKAAVSDAPAKVDSKAKAVVLLDDTVLTVGADGRAVERRRHVVKILRPTGREEGYVFVPFDKDTKILSLHVWSIGADGHEYEMRDKEIAEVGYPGAGNFYEDVRVKVAEPPGRDPGGVVAYEVEQRQEPYMHESTWFFEDEIPHAKQSFTLELPPGYAYRTTWGHHAPVAGADLEHQRTRWEMNGTKPLDLDEVTMRPSRMALDARMTVQYGAAGSELGTWKGIGEWYAGLAKDRLTPTPEITAKAQALTAGKSDFYDRTEAIAEYVQQQVRYFVIEMGVGGFQPHPAGDIFRNQYGDCKDKATLLSAMLNAVGTHAALMMVDHRRGVVDPAAPSLVGDHMIAAIELPKGYESAKLRSVVTAKTGKRYLIFDPTWDKTAFGQLEHNLQGGYGILLEGEDTEAVQLPVLAPGLNTIKRQGTLTLKADGTLSGTVTETRFGDISERRRELFTTEDATAQRKVLNEALNRDFASFAMSDLKVENAAALNKDLRMSYRLEAERYSRNLGTLVMVRPRVLGSESMPVDHETRWVPVDLGETMQATDDFTIELPQGWTMDEIPEAVKLDVGFASYTSASEVKGNALHYTRTYTVKQVELPPERYGDVRKLAETIDADEQSKAVFKQVQ